MMTLTIEQLRAERDAREREEFEQRTADMRSRLLPLLILDLRGELDEQSGRDLLEILDDFELSDTDYDQIRQRASELAGDYATLQKFESQLEDEHISTARAVVLRRRLEVAAQAAKNLLWTRHLTQKNCVHLRRQIWNRRDDFPFFFEPGDAPEVLQSVRDLPVKPKDDRPQAETVRCPVCWGDFPASKNREFCGARCEKIVEDHQSAIDQLQLLEPKGKGSADGKRKPKHD